MAITRITSPAITSVSSTSISGTLPAANINDTSIGNITALPAGVGGKVLQIVQASTSTYAESSSNTYADTGLSVTITPTSTSNKIYIVGTQADCFKSNGNSSNSIHLRLLRDTTEILYIADRALLTVTTIENMNNIGFNYLDTPSTTSAITYKTQFHNHTSVNRVTVQQQNDGTSTITAMEIAG